MKTGITAVSSSNPVDRGNLPGRLATWHALAAIVFLSWRFGGMESCARTIAGCWCLAAPAVTWFAWRRAGARLRTRFLRVVLPLAALAAVVLASALNPSMRLLTSGEQPTGLVAREDYLRFLPSTVWPADTIRDFFFNAGLILVGLNLFLANPGRRCQKTLMAVIAANTAVLACAGSIFKLSNASAIFDIVPSPNPNFFASFVYYNHWGGFAVLGAAAAAGLALQCHARTQYDPERHSPALLLGMVAMIILISLPLSGARASSAAGAVLALAIALRFALRRRTHGNRGLAAVAVAAALIALLTIPTFFFARNPADFMARKTAAQIADLRGGGIGDARLPVYRDTWRLFLQQPVFGWGWHSYRYAFRRVQSFDFMMQTEQKEKSVLLNAHNDWLQLLAELGLVGAALSAGAILGIARIASRRWWGLSPSFEILAGLGCLCLLACVDFPFACPAIVVTAWTLLAVGAGIAFDRESAQICRNSAPPHF